MRKKTTPPRFSALPTTPPLPRRRRNRPPCRPKAPAAKAPAAKAPAAKGAANKAAAEGNDDAALDDFLNSLGLEE